MTEWERGVIETYTGERFAPFDPEPERVHLTDIAAGLAHTCRFGGHSDRFYSVAEHSLYVSEEFTEPRLQLIALLHDAAEAYLGDIPRPVKAEFERFAEAEEAILATVWEAFALSPPTEDEWELVMDADDRLLAYEVSHLLSDGSWADDPPVRPYQLGSNEIEAVRTQFENRGRELLVAV